MTIWQTINLSIGIHTYINKARSYSLTWNENKNQNGSDTNVIAKCTWQINYVHVNFVETVPSQAETTIILVSDKLFLSRDNHWNCRGIGVLPNGYCHYGWNTTERIYSFREVSETTWYGRTGYNFYSYYYIHVIIVKLTIV